MVASNFDIYTASDHLPKYLLGTKGASYDVTETAFQCAVGTTKPRWDWLAEKISPEQISPETGVGYPGVPSAANVNVKPNDNGKVTRPELENFGLAMIGGGKTSGAAHPYGEYLLSALLQQDCRGDQQRELTDNRFSME